MKLSNSQVGILEKCERMYFHQYINKTQKDVNYIKPDFFTYGNILHKLLELCLKREELSFEEMWVIVKKEQEYNDFIKEQEEDFKAKMYLDVYLFRMFLNYNHFITIVSELRLETKTCVIVVDWIVIINRKFWIIDFKTHSGIGASNDYSIQKMHLEPQTSLYAAHAPVLKKYLNIEEEFGGVAFLQFDKPKNKMTKKDSSYINLANRILEEKGRENLIRFLAVQAKDINIETYIDNFSKQYEKAQKMHQTKDFGTQNLNACIEPFSGACPYFSQCYGILSNENKKVFVINGVEEIKNISFEEQNFLEGL